MNAVEFGMKIVLSLNVVYIEEEGYVIVDVVKEKGFNIKKFSGIKFC